MSRKITILDDLDSALEADGTTLFALDGECYEIDLADKNAKSLRDALAKYVEVARQIPVRDFARRVAGDGTQNDYDPAVVREWAKQRGIKVSDKGRVSEDVVKQWREATEQPAGTAS